MPYINTQLGTFGHSLATVRAAYPEVSVPSGVSHGDFEWYEPTTVTLDPRTHTSVEVAPVGGVQQWSLVPVAREVQVALGWERIKAERDRRAGMGVKAGTHWFHSDQKSRTQQLGLVLLGQGIPAGLQWKTLAYTPQPVFVSMTPALAVAIVQATAASDTAIFTAAEVHRMAMEASPEPGSYDFTGGWPPSFEDEAHEAGFAVDASVF